MPGWIGDYWQVAVEITLIAVVIYYVLKMLRGSRGAGILRGVFLLFAVAFLLGFLWRFTDMYRITYLLEQFLKLFVFVLIIVFQPELRRGLVRLGQRSLLGSVFRRETAMIREVVDAVHRMSEYRIGALITFEREIGLKTYIEGGTRLDAEVTSGLLGAIFYPGGPLHDGAAIISEQRVVAAGCLFPLSEKTGLAKTMGTRHRAGIGVTEESDAVSLIVSEESGRVSVAVGGRLTENVPLDRVASVLTDLVVREPRERRRR